MIGIISLFLTKEVCLQNFTMYNVFSLNSGKDKMVHEISDQLEMAQQGQGSWSHYQQLFIQQQWSVWHQENINIYAWDRWNE